MFLLLFLSSFIFIKKGYLQGASHTRLKIEDKAKVPMKELSGLTLLNPKDDPHFVAIGDKKAELIFFTRSNNENKIIKRRNFGDLLLDRFSLCSEFVGDLCHRQMQMLVSDWEGITADPQYLYLLQEHSTAIIVLSRTDEDFIKIINLDFSPFQKHGAKVPGIFNRNSKLSEGLLLLKNGHIIAAKEGDPMVIVEFAPQQSDTPPLGLNNASLLNAGDDFQLPFKNDISRVKFKAIASWTFRGSSKCDVSDLATSPDKQSFYFISQKCRTISEIAPLTEQDSQVKIVNTWSIPRKVHNPEGLFVTANGDFVIVSDRKSTKKNNFFRLSRN